MGVIRAFIPIEIPDEIRSRLGQVTDQLNENVPTKSVRWVPSQNVHLTLKFLGDVSEANYEVLIHLLETQAKLHTPFDISVGGLGAYPTEKRPRVIWVGIQADQELFELQRGIDAETTRLGYGSEDREYSPHLTIGRISRNASAEDVRLVGSALGKLDLGFLGVSRVSHLHLYKSDLKPGGAVYTRLFSAPLGMGSSQGES
jgi:2'-5' RNA ligase